MHAILRASRRATPSAFAAWRRAATSLVIPGTPRELVDVVHLDLLQNEEPGRISAIWESFHESKDGIAGKCVDAIEHETIIERGSESPMFVFPIRREGGHFMLLSQFTAAQRMFVLTSLAEYQQNPAVAQPWASVHLFDDLLDTKAVALVRTEVMLERLTTEEAEHLILLLRRYYGTKAYDKVWTFNHSEKHFDLEAYLRDCP